MRFMMIIKADEKSEAGVLPSQEDLTAMGNYNQKLIDAGIMLGGEGLQASSKGARVRYSAGKSRVLDGPFTEAKELVAGFWIIDVKSKEEALEWAARVPVQDTAIELRPLYEPEDFPLELAEQPGGSREQEQAASAGARKPGTRRYIAMLKADQYTEAGRAASAKLLREMGALMQEMTASGVLLSGDGLRPSAQGARVVFTGKTPRVIDGPFTETKELVAGYSVLQTRTLEEAIEWARRTLQIHVDGTGVGEGMIEVRSIFELEDFPVEASEAPDGWRAQEQRFREQSGQ
jgi:hypothetical protein